MPRVEHTEKETVSPIKRYNMEHPHDHDGEDPISMLRHKKIAELVKRNRKAVKR